MKLSLAWIFDHIVSGKSRTLPDIQQIIRSFSSTPAEIDHFYEFSFNLQDFSLVQVLDITDSDITVECFEWRKKIVLSSSKNIAKGGLYLIKKENRDYRWATMNDFGAHKDGLFPEVYCTEQERAGDWKKNVETHDYILEIDNISITNRPDMWNHRGCARELSVTLGMKMVPEEHLVVALPIHHYVQRSLHDRPNSYTMEIESGAPCSRFAGIELSQVSVFPSSIYHALRLARLEVRSHNLAVDLTNYVMLDIGNPMHVFDANKIHDKTIMVRYAHKGEKLLLLDNTVIELTTQDCIIADNKEVLSLAGISGGKTSGVQEPTTFFLEAAHFDPIAIRKTAARHKKRTESSIRFEKNLDPHGNTTAIMRYIKLLDDMGITYTTPGFIISLGSFPAERTISVEHRFIVDRLGINVLPGRVEEILRALGFGIIVTDGMRGGIYQVMVPTWRAKDIIIKEDIVEEVGRFIGYNNINPVIPVRAMVPQDQSAVFFQRTVKQQCAFALHMREVANYALYDEQFLYMLALDPHDAPPLKNPLSEHWRRLVTSLVPHLLKNVAINAANEDALRFFEWAHIWKQEQDKVLEYTSCAGIFYDRYGKFDFYDGKTELQSLFQLLDLLVEWRKTATVQAWMNDYQTAALVCQDMVIGYAGMVADAIVTKAVPHTPHAKIFTFELNMDAIRKLHHLEKKYEEPSKYQSVSLDISMLAPYTVTVGMLEDALARSDARIHNVVLLDSFDKPEWENSRSLTFRCVVQDSECTMTKEDIDQVQAEMQTAVKKHGVEIR